MASRSSRSYLSASAAAGGNHNKRAPPAAGASERSRHCGPLIDMHAGPVRVSLAREPSVASTTHLCSARRLADLARLDSLCTYEPRVKGGRMDGADAADAASGAPQVVSRLVAHNRIDANLCMISCAPPEAGASTIQFRGQTSASSPTALPPPLSRLIWRLAAGAPHEADAARVPSSRDDSSNYELTLTNQRH